MAPGDQTIGTRGGARRATRHMFRSLRIRNYRLFVIGQLVSVTGLGIQQVGLAWLVVERTESGVALGTTVALQFLPILLFGMWGGLLADRLDKRRLLLCTQVAAAVLALALWAVVAGGNVDLWMIYALAFGTGCAQAIDMPARQAFVVEMVGPAEVPNAVALNSAVFNAGRLVGSAIGGLVIVALGVSACFLLNAVTFSATVVALARMDTALLLAGPRATRRRGQVREGLRYAWSTPALRSPLLLVAVVGTIGFNFAVIVPLLAREDLGGGPRLLGLLMSAMGLGSLVGALVAAARARPTRHVLVGAAAAFGLLSVASAASSDPWVVAPLLGAAGLCVMVFLATANATLQIESDPAMRGRVMSLYGLVFLGSTPVGGPLMGWISERFGARTALALAGFVCLAAAGAASRARGKRAWRRQPPTPADTPADASADDELVADPVVPPGGVIASDPIEAA